MSTPLACIILAAGNGSRMKSALPKVMHKIAGVPMLGHVLAAVTPLKPEKVVVVLAPGMDAAASYASAHTIVIQEKPLGTADAVKAAASALKDFTGDVLIVCGDDPLTTTESLARLVGALHGGDNPRVVMMGTRPADPGPYGRLISGRQGLDRIVEAADASEQERQVDLVWSGSMVATAKSLFSLIEQIDNINTKKEYYLTAIVAKAKAANIGCGVVEMAAEEFAGVNSRADLAAAEAALQKKLRAAAMANGATLIDPASTFFSADTRLGHDVIIEPNVFFGPNVVIDDNVHIKAFSHIEGAVIKSGAVIGPFARIRPGSTIAEDAHVGNFVELKNTQLGAGAKANHLTYLGDAEVGAGSNIGAGTITCNYDGHAKHKTIIGAGSFIGSDAVLVAPVTLADFSFVAAGSVVTDDVGEDELAIARVRQENKPGKGSRTRARLRNTE